MKLETPLFSCVMIVRNEAAVLYKAIYSLRHFLARGGQLVIVDTGSTDGTVKIAKDACAEIVEVGKRFLQVIDKETADKVNQRFVVDDEPSLLKEGDTIFDFASARNYAASLSKNNWILCMDADEIFEKIDVEAINEIIRKGKHTQITYDYQFAPNIQFRQCKTYDRRFMSWRCRIHEVLEGDSKPVHLDRSKFFLRHEQNKASDRTSYLRSLALDCYEHPEADRQSHYFARECYYYGMWKTAIKEFERHWAMKKWPAEAAQSLNFAGTCWERLGNDDKAVETWHRALQTDATRREPLILLAQHYQRKKDHLRAVLYATASLELPLVDYYANDLSHYQDVPHQILYVSLWWLGRKKESKAHWKKALEYQPTNAKYLSDAQFYA